jgi:COMPASS component SWD2
MRLEEGTMANFKVAKTFKQGGRINYIDYTHDGLQMITSNEDDAMVLYDCEKGTESRVVNSQKYGVDLVHFTHAKNAVVYASNKEGKDQAVRYLSLHDNKYLKYFSGHNGKVVSLSMSPCDDTVISGSLDKTVRLWDLRSPNCIGLMQCQGRPIASFDPEGLIFAVGVQSEQVKLYDLKSFDKGPFSTFKYKIESGCDWTGIKFSLDGKLMMLTTNGAVIRVLDAFEGKPLHTLQGYLNNKGLPIEASFSPDSQFIISGSTDGKLHVWRAETGVKVAVLTGEHSQPVTAVKFNPRYMLMASACNSVNFWLPSQDQQRQPSPSAPQVYIPTSINAPPARGGGGGGGSGSYTPGYY